MILTGFFSFLEDVDGFIEGLFGRESPPEKKKAVMTQEFDSAEILNSDDFMKDAIRRYTLRSVTESLSRAGYSEGIDCHSRAHELGRMAYEIVGDDAFSQCGIDCHSGCRHGATEAFFADKGTSGLKENVNLLCEDELNSFNTHQCFHGIGHGLMAWSDYEIHDALGSCDLLDSRSSRSSCYTGVFMENIVGGIALGEGGEDGYHYTAYLSDDPHYPCTAVGDKYRYECYFLQTDRMLSLLGDIDLVGPECARAPAQFMDSCFHSMGRTVSGLYRRDAARSIETCRKIPNASNSETCIYGALQDHLWDESQADGAVEFCRLIQNTSFEQECYATIIIRAADVVSDMPGFCEKLPGAYLDQCLGQKPSVAYRSEQEQETVAVSLPPVEKTENAVIRYSGGRYLPDKIHVSVGQEVTWVSDDQAAWPASNLHPTHTAYPGSDIKKCGTSFEKDIFDACGPVETGGNFSFVFGEPGQWRYHDHINPRATGIVYVSGE